MWGYSDSDEYPGRSDSDTESLENEKAPGPDGKGLALAEYSFGPLLSPVTATPGQAQWTAYTENRRAINKKYQNVFTRRKRTISDAVAVIEKDMELDEGALQKCVSIIGRLVEWDDEDPRDADIAVRIFSPAAPKYIDVHIKYHCRPRMESIEWAYSIGYKICHQVSSSSTFRDPSTEGPIPHWHTRDGWKSICWGYYDDDQDYDRRWRRIEVTGMGLNNQQAVLDIYETVFGPIEEPPSDDEDAMIEYRSKLVASVRLLLAAVGIQYEIACSESEEEWDRRPRDYMLEGLSDKWVARGIRKACGFQLSEDADAEKRGRKEREEQAMGMDDDEYESGFSNEGGSDEDSISDDDY